MVNVLSNLVKLADYPFAYSLVGQLLLINGHKIDWKNPDLTVLGPLIPLIGILATTLSITDPFGNILRLVLRQGYAAYPAFRAVYRDPYRATSTDWISYEIDKIVSIFYFLIILILILIFSSNFVPKSLLGNNLKRYEPVRKVGVIS
jgi:hypothetical protein